MKLSDLPHRRVAPLGDWPVETGHLSACARYRAKNAEACRARVRASKLKSKQRALGVNGNSPP